MTEGLTHHRFEFDLGGGKTIVRELDIPFNEDEITRLQTAYEIKKEWSQRAMDGSGLVRELYATLVDIPWGTSLLHRENVLGSIRKTILNIRDVKERYGNNHDYVGVASDLTQIEAELLPFIPEMKLEDNK